MDIGVSDEEEDEKDKKEDQLNSDDFSESDGEWQLSAWNPWEVEMRQLKNDDSGVSFI